jgi:hypothetical protein
MSYPDDIDPGDYFERLDRYREIMAGDPDYDEATARDMARQESSRLKDSVDNQGGNT